MKSFFLLSVAVILAVSCSERNNSSKNNSLSAVDTEMHEHLPFNLYYGMSRADFEHIRDSLKQRGQLDKWKSEFLYENLRLGLRYDFNDEDELVHFELSSSGLYSPSPAQSRNFISQIEKMLTEQGINLNAYTKNVVRLDKNHRNVTYTQRGYGEIYISDNIILLVRFLNDDAVAENNKNWEQIVKQAESDVASGHFLQKVENSSLDGSVKQVKDYLKKTLYDPKSYEGIEWSPVKAVDDGYRVRHKYRAKNTFGGYVIEEHIFVLNKYGEVINVL